MVEALSLGSHEGFAEDRHAGFPFRFTNDGQSLDVFPMLEVKFQVFPESAGE